LREMLHTLHAWSELAWARTVSCPCLVCMPWSWRLGEARGRACRGNCCIFALQMAYAAGSNASVTAVTSAAVAPVAVVCSAGKRLALTAADLGATSSSGAPSPGLGLGLCPSSASAASAAASGAAAGVARAAAAGAAAAPRPAGANPARASIAALYDVGASNGTVSAFVAEVAVDAGFQARWACPMLQHRAGVRVTGPVQHPAVMDLHATA